MGKSEIAHPPYGELRSDKHLCSFMIYNRKDFSPMSFYLIPTTQMNKLKHKILVRSHSWLVKWQN